MTLSRIRACVYAFFLLYSRQKKSLGAKEMDNKDLLIASAARLYTLGIDLETARDRVRQLVEQGVPYNSDEMKQAVQDFKKLEQQWKELEKQHLEMKAEIVRTTQNDFE